MTKKFSLSTIILLFVLGSFVLYESSMMFAGLDDMTQEVSAFGSFSTFPLILLFFSVIYLLSTKPRVPFSIYRVFLIFFIFTYVLTIFWSLFYPLNSRIVLFSSFLPICFWLLGDSLCVYKREDTIKLYLPICFIFLAIYFFLSFDVTLMLDKEHAAINASYVIIYLLPFILLSEKRFIRILGIIITALISVASLKRGGMISLSVGLLFYLIVYFKVKTGKSISLKGIFFLALAGLAIFYLITYLNESMEGLVFNRFTSIEQDGGSGREDIYKEVQGMISNSSFGGLLFGHGWNGVMRDSASKLSAHNDFLEIIYDFGVIAFVLYIIFVFKLLAHLFKLIKHNHPEAPALSASIGIFLANSMFSHIYIYAWYIIIFTFFWGFIFRDTYKLVKK